MNAMALPTSTCTRATPALRSDSGITAWIIPLAFSYGFLIAPVLMFSSTASTEFGPGINLSTAEGSTTNKMAWLALAGLTGYAWMKRGDKNSRGADLPVLLLLAYLLLALASIFWSDVPLIGLRRTLQQVLLFICMLAPFAIVSNPSAVVEKACWVFAAVLVVNAVVLPVTGIPGFGYRGIYGQKNAMGQVAATAFYFCLYGTLLYSGYRRWLFGAMALLATGLCLASHSKTSQGLLVMMPLLAAGLVGLFRLRSPLARATIMVFGFFCTAAVVAAALLIPIGIGDISAWLYHDTTFTGRTAIWEFAGHYIDQAPLLGYGYGSFWGVGQATRSIGQGFIAGLLQAHNGYVDVVLETGYLGLTLTTAMIIALLVSILRLARRDGLLAWLVLTCLLFVLLNNAMESSLFRSYVPLWMVFLFCCGAAGFSFDASAARPALDRISKKAISGTFSTRNRTTRFFDSSQTNDAKPWIWAANPFAARFANVSFNGLAKRIGRSALAKNSFVYTVDFGLQIAVQAVYLLLLSRALGPANYGILSSLMAISIIGSTFVGWGCDHILIKNVAVDQSKFRDNLGHAFIAIAFTLPVVFVITYLFVSNVLESHKILPYTVAAILISDLCFTKLLFLAKACFASVERAKPQLIINILATLLKLGSAIVFTSIASTPTIDCWALWYCSSTAISAAIGLFLVFRELEGPRWTFLHNEMGLGFQFCLEFAALAALRDADKPVVVSVLGAEAGGHYAVAFRAVDAASTPIRGILYATYTRYFRLANESAKMGIDFGLRILPFAAGLSIAIGVALFSFAWLLPHILGSNYESTVELVRLLVAYPFLLAFTGIGADILRAIGQQRIRVMLMASSSLVMVPISWLAAANYGVNGASLARTLVQTGLVTVLWLLVIKHRKNDACEI